MLASKARVRRVSHFAPQRAKQTGGSVQRQTKGNNQSDEEAKKAGVQMVYDAVGRFHADLAKAMEIGGPDVILMASEEKQEERDRHA
jgi:hypothetical protein